MPKYRAWLSVSLVAAFLSACSAAPTPTPTPTAVDTRPTTALPADATAVVDGPDAGALAIATSRALFRHSPAAVVTDEAHLPEASSRAAALGVPVLLAPVLAPGPSATGDAAHRPDGDLRAELSRLGIRTLVAFGSGPSTWAATVPAPTGGDARVSVISDGAAVPGGLSPAPPLSDLLVLALDDPLSAAAVATAHAAGARVLTVHDPDPRTDPATITALHGQPTAHVLGIGGGFGPAERLRARVDTAATGVQLPGGGQVVFPGRRMVALYGHPGDRVLGSLGEQPLAAAVTRAKKVAADYAALVHEPVIPTFEIIATVASSAAGADGDYSSEASIDFLRPWVDAAADAGMYVMLDLQPGRTDFLTQAKRYEELLKRSNVGLALDPEWRLGPNQFHMVQIGSVGAAEINQTAQWLADLTRANHLPQKILMVHQFRLDMITDRSTLVTSYDELNIVIHVDGFGSTAQKLSTWATIRRNAPPNIWWGWKNFYDEDTPTLSPQQTVAVDPSPVFVSYQ